MTPDIEFHTEGTPWFPLPEKLPSSDFANATAVAGNVLAVFLQHYGKDVKVGWGVKLQNYLEEAAQGQYSGIFLWMTEPLVPVPVVTAAVYPAQGTAEETLPLIGGASHGEPFSSPGLGDGLRFDSSTQIRKGLFGKATRRTVRWAWRIDAVDLLVTLERDDDESLARMLPDVEALLRGATVSR